MGNPFGLQGSAQVRVQGAKVGTVLISRESKNSGKMVSARRAEANMQREHQAPPLQQPAGMWGRL